MWLVTVEEIVAPLLGSVFFTVKVFLNHLRGFWILLLISTNNPKFSKVFLTKLFWKHLIELDFPDVNGGTNWNSLNPFMLLRVYILLTHDLHDWNIELPHFKKCIGLHKKLHLY